MVLHCKYLAPLWNTMYVLPYFTASFFNLFALVSLSFNCCLEQKHLGINVCVRQVCRVEKLLPSPLTRDFETRRAVFISHTREVEPTEEVYSKTATRLLRRALHQCESVIVFCFFFTSNSNVRVGNATPRRRFRCVRNST